MISGQWQCSFVPSQCVTKGGLMMLLPKKRWPNLQTTIECIQIRNGSITFNWTDTLKLFYKWQSGKFETFRWKFIKRMNVSFFSPIVTSLGNPFGTKSVFKFVSPSKLAVVTKHFASGSDVFNSTKSHGTSQSLDAFTRSPWRISSHFIAHSTPFRITVTE